MSPTINASPTASGVDTAHRVAALAARYDLVRMASDNLCRPLSPEDATAQSMTDTSPAKWHLAHTTWFFETLVLESAVPDYRHFHADFRVLFNSYYNSIGEQGYRPERGLITRPGLSEVYEYRSHVDRHMKGLLAPGSDLPDATCDVIEIGLSHEQQHQELMVTDIKHLLSRNPLLPAYQESRRPEAVTGIAPVTWTRIEEGTRWIGHDGDGFAYDNERPRHREFLEAFQLASRPVTNGEYLEFMEQGAYRQPLLWLSDGWATLRETGWEAPLYWERQGDAWLQFTMGGMQQVRREDPVTHVSFFEADAFARWAGARLPTEAEWETVAADTPIRGNFVESGELHPRAVDRTPRDGPEQLYGDVWEWTRSPYGRYPGYVPPPGPLGEYNSKFMCDQLVLRGGSCATPESHIRPTYRNFFPATARWQFSGIRLARDA